MKKLREERTKILKERKFHLSACVRKPEEEGEINIRHNDLWFVAK